MRRQEDVVPLSADHLHRHDLHVEGDTGRASCILSITRAVRGVVGELADRARDVGAVAVEVVGCVVVR